MTEMEEWRVNPKNGIAMNMTAFTSVMFEININHKFIKGRCIKYVDPTFDMRDFSCFIIRFRGMFEPITFDCRQSDEPLYDRIMKWLVEGRK